MTFRFSNPEHKFEDHTYTFEISDEQILDALNNAPWMLQTALDEAQKDPQFSDDSNVVALMIGQWLWNSGFIETTGEDDDE